MSKVQNNKQHKKDSLLNNAFTLFTEKGLNKTTISDIAEKAGVAKGTFYLYFKDKYDIRNRLIANKSAELFGRAYKDLQREKPDAGFEEGLLFIADHILNELNENKTLLAFLHKDLSWSAFKKSFDEATVMDDNSLEEYVRKLFEKSSVRFRDPETMLFLIIELIGSAGYSSIIYGEPCPLEELKPDLMKSIQSIIDTFRISAA